MNALAKLYQAAIRKDQQHFLSDLLELTSDEYAQIIDDIMRQCVTCLAPKDIEELQKKIKIVFLNSRKTHALIMKNENSAWVCLRELISQHPSSLCEEILQYLNNEYRKTTQNIFEICCVKNNIKKNYVNYSLIECLSVNYTEASLIKTPENTSPVFCVELVPDVFYAAKFAVKQKNNDILKGCMPNIYKAFELFSKNIFDINENLNTVCRYLGKMIYDLSNGLLLKNTQQVLWLVQKNEVMSDLIAAVCERLQPIVFCSPISQPHTPAARILVTSNLGFKSYKDAHCYADAVLGKSGLIIIEKKYPKFNVLDKTTIPNVIVYKHTFHRNSVRFNANKSEIDFFISLCYHLYKEFASHDMQEILYQPKSMIDTIIEECANDVIKSLINYYKDFDKNKSALMDKEHFVNFISEQFRCTLSECKEIVDFCIKNKATLIPMEKDKIYIKLDSQKID